MTTKEIVKSLPKNKLIRSIVPDWAHPTIPFPFFRNGIPCLGFYYYQLKTTNGKHLIEAPIMQLITTYPTGHIVGITASPFFMLDKNDASLELGEYPNATLKSLSLEESNKCYDDYYAACDSFFEKNNHETWKKAFTQVKEEGMDRFFALFSSEPLVITRNINYTKHSTEQSHDIICDPSAANTLKQNSLSARTRHILRDIQAFLDKPYFSKEANEFKQIVVDNSRKEYNIAVIGEFSRGKSSFLNALLDIDYLPTGDLPTTAVLTRIINNPVKTAVFIDKSKSVRKVDLINNGLSQFLADDQGNDPEGVLQVSIPIEWMRDKTVVFFDTPGAGDIVGKRADITRNAIAHCDCTIMAISAQAACSITELEFLKENVLLKSVPRCCIIITKLDTIPESERMEVVSHVKAKIKTIAPSAEFWVANDMPGIEKDMLDAYGISNIRSRILNLCCSDGEINSLREQQLLNQMLFVLDAAKNEIKLIEESEKLSDEEKNKIIKKLEYNKDHLHLIEEELLLICERMKYKTEQDIETELEEIQTDLLKDCKMSLQKTGTTKEWVEKDFPYMVEKSMKNIIAKMEKKILYSVTNFRTELGSLAKERLSCAGLTVEIPSCDSINPNADIDFTPENIDKTRLLSRCATVISVPFAFLFLGPFATLVSGGLGLASELFLKKKIDEQKDMISQQIDKSLFSMFEEIKKHLHDYIERCYSEIIKAVGTESKKAIDNAISKIQTASHERATQVKESSILLDEINNLKQSISNIN